MTKLTIAPVTPGRWPDLEKLFSLAGVCQGCYCMTWRKPPRVFEADKGEGNRRSMRQRVMAGPPPGLLAYAGSADPIGWVAVAPRAEFTTIANSRVWAPVDPGDAAGVWSITCFFVARPWRGRGATVELIRAAARFAFSQGASVVEGYPIDPGQGSRQPDTFIWTGLASAFRAAGFAEAARRSPKKPIMRLARGNT